MCQNAKLGLPLLLRGGGLNVTHNEGWGGGGAGKRNPMKQ